MPQTAPALASPDTVADHSVDAHIRAVIGLSQNMLTDVVQALERINDINKTIHILSMNARVEAARAGDAGRGFAVVAQELTRLSTSTDEVAKGVEQNSRQTGGELNALAQQLLTDVVDTRLCDLAANAMDLIDRNLYERSCDVRWWATDSAVVDGLADPSPERLAFASQRLGQILDSYTVYFDLLLVDAQGRVVANGRPQAHRSVGQDVSRTTWFQSACATHDGTQFGFESVHASALVGGERVLVYACTVREGGDVKGQPLGVLGIVFRWDGLGLDVMQRTPLTASEWAVTRTVITDDTGQVLTANDPARIGSRLDFAGRDQLFAQPRGALDTRIAGVPVRVAHALSAGFETYRTGWHSLVLRQLTPAAGVTARRP